MPYFHSLCDKKTFAGKSTPGECALSFWVDFIFSRELFTKCSWAGGSRDKNRPKAAFKQFEYVINFLMDLARTVEPSYTLIAAQNFIKSILQYSTRRNVAEPMRRSAPKLRPSTGRTIRKKKGATDDKADEHEDDGEFPEYEDFGEPKFSIVFSPALASTVVSSPTEPKFSIVVSPALASTVVSPPTTPATTTVPIVPATVFTVEANGNAATTSVADAASAEQLPTFSQTFADIPMMSKDMGIEITENQGILFSSEDLLNTIHVNQPSDQNQSIIENISIQKPSLNADIPKNLAVEEVADENNKLGIMPTEVDNDDADYNTECEKGETSEDDDAENSPGSEDESLRDANEIPASIIEVSYSTPVHLYDLWINAHEIIFFDFRLHQDCIAKKWPPKSEKV